jgi:hypothetical protein
LTAALPCADADDPNGTSAVKAAASVKPVVSATASRFMGGSG